MSEAIPCVRVYFREDHLPQYFENAYLGISPQNNYIVEYQDTNEKWVFPADVIHSVRVFMIDP